MKTMKFLAVLVMLSLSMGVSAQNALQKKVKENKAALKEKASKDAKKEAKRLQKACRACLSETGNIPEDLND